ADGKRNRSDRSQGPACGGAAVGRGGERFSGASRSRQNGRQGVGRRRSPRYTRGREGPPVRNSASRRAQRCRGLGASQLSGEVILVARISLFAKSGSQHSVKPPD